MTKLSPETIKNMSEGRRRFYHNRLDRRRMTGFHTTRNFQKKRGVNRLSTSVGVMKVHWDGEPDIWLNSGKWHIIPDLDPDDLRVRIRAILENYKFSRYICTRDEALPVGNMRIPLTSHWSSSGIWSFYWKLAVIILIAIIVIQVLFS